MGRETIPLLSRYRDPSTNCFVYDTFNDPDINLYTLKMYFNITSLASIFSEEAKMYFHVHYPGQMVRNMKNYIVKVKDWHRFGSEQMNNEIFVQFPELTLYRFRDNALEACDQKLFDDDSKWMQNVIQVVGCIPIGEYIESSYATLPTN